MPSPPPPLWAGRGCWSARRVRPPLCGGSPTSPPSPPGSPPPPEALMADLSLWPIGNCQVSALVDREAGFVWGCAPRVDGDPLFCSLLEPKNGASAMPRGEWRLGLENQVSAEQSYLRNTPILSTRLTDADGGIAEIFDFCPRFERSGRMYRPVAFVRIVRPVAGAPRLRVELDPATDWGSRDSKRTSGSNHVRYLLEPQPLRLTTDAPIGNVMEARPFRLEQAHHFFL